MEKKDLILFLIIVVLISLIFGIGIGILLSIQFNLTKIYISSLFFIISILIAVWLISVSKLGKKYKDFISKK